MKSGMLAIVVSVAFAVTVRAASETVDDITWNYSVNAGRATITADALKPDSSPLGPLDRFFNASSVPH